MSTILALPGVASAAAHTQMDGQALAFSVPAQPLATALIDFGKQANVQVLTAGSTIARFRSLGVSGTLTPQDALARLLQGTGLDYAFTQEGTVVVKPREATSASGGARAKAPIEAKQLTAVEANALVGHDVGFMASLNSMASRNDNDMIDVPQSVSVVTRDLMESQQLLTVADAVRNVAGVQYVEGSDGLPLFQIRGFYTSYGLTDGMPNSIAGSGDFPPLIGLQRVEVLKGPQSVLGDTTGGNFGGLINVTIKQPQFEPVRELTYTIGEQGQAQAGMDFGGPLGQTPGLSYRMVISGEYGDRSPQGYRNQRSAYLAPSIGWRGDSTDVVVGAQRILNRVPITDHVVLLGDTLSTASPDGLLPGNPRDFANYQTDRLYYLLDQQVGDAWTWRSRGQYVRQRNNLHSWTLYDPQLDGDTSAYAEAYRYDDTYYSLQNDLIRTFDTGSVQHTVTVGLDYARSRIGHSDDFLHSYDEGVYNLFTSRALPTVAAVIQPQDNQPLGGTPWSVDSGLFLQDQLALGERWEMLLALRRASYEVSTDDVDGNPWTPSRVKWVPNAGLVYKLTRDIALYAGTANGFQPVSFLGENGRPLVPALSRQLEAGAKFNLFDERARLTVSAYRIMLDHSYLLVEEQPPNFATFGPGQTNRGIEVEFAGQVTPGLDLSGSYANAMIRNHDGSRATGAPRQRFNAWVSYWFQNEALRGWGIAGGVLARSRSLGQSLDYTTYFPTPGQAEVGANVSYRAARWRMTLGVKNLLARRLIADDFNETFVPIRTRRSYLLSGSYDF
ncbi:MAG TPA: TonB-dependent receptor [Dyella sp.]|uniref:TonB-dependent siderophore receptor n=1 Tax=Dyella sp. TaxID=1869338 RepID=UPI002D77B600|nr:TonB-dependent receptor [Dyella sp.]HET6555163.1 TonB-dependent receptor [Dyella sp.]